MAYLDLVQDTASQGLVPSGRNCPLIANCMAFHSPEYGVVVHTLYSMHNALYHT